MAESEYPAFLSHLELGRQPSIDEVGHQFVTSKGWFEKFKKPHSLHSLKIQGERASTDADAADKYSEEFAKTIKEHYYLPDQIFQADETDNAPSHATDSCHRNIQVKEVWKQFSILNCVEIVGTSLKEICQSTLRACWKALLPEATVEETVTNPVEDKYRNLVRLANVIRGDGFDEITVDDI
uniref:HTH CENPB-type domain-containing protein n=1 Tax=Glossina austeni TaxID=7395 RepID=A0A1A9UNP3_GLOAU